MQNNFLNVVAAADNCTYDGNEVLSHTGDQPPACFDAHGDTWLCPDCHPGGRFAKNRTGLGHIGGANVMKCHHCGYIAVMRYSLQHAGYRRVVSEEMLQEQVKDPAAAWEATIERSSMIR